MGSEDVLEILYRLFLRHGKPEVVRSGKGPEFASKATQGWLKDQESSFGSRLFVSAPPRNNVADLD
ncbi:hypothetical protein [Ruegeria jejuensis]|uniref:hypothetical protein n=1 Tax=Ruegeria jejuensis TaxID=3233338 RepID=UPI00355C84AC